MTWHHNDTLSECHCNGTDFLWHLIEFHELVWLRGGGVLEWWILQNILYTPLSKHSLTGMVSGMWQTNKGGWGLSQTVMCQWSCLFWLMLQSKSSETQSALWTALLCIVFCSGPWTVPLRSKHSHRESSFTVYLLDRDLCTFFFIQKVANELIWGFSVTH